MYRFISWIRSVTRLQYLVNIRSQDGGQQLGNYTKKKEEVISRIPTHSNQNPVDNKLKLPQINKQPPSPFYTSENRSQNVAVKMSNLESYTEMRKGEEKVQDPRQDIVSKRYDILPVNCGRYLNTQTTSGPIITPYEFPWLAEIKLKNGQGMYLGSHFGSVIHSRYVLTVAIKKIM